MKALKIQFKNQPSKFEKLDKTLKKMKSEGLIHSYISDRKRIYIIKRGPYSYHTYCLAMKKSRKVIYLNILHDETISTLEKKVLALIST